MYRYIMYRNIDDKWPKHSKQWKQFLYAILFLILHSESTISQSVTTYCKMQQMYHAELQIQRTAIPKSSFKDQHTTQVTEA